MKFGNFKEQKGHALVELALTLPLLLLVVFGIFEFGRAIYIKNTLNNAAREGARWASVSDPLNIATVQDHVRICIPLSLQPGLVIGITPATPKRGIDPVTVTVTLPFHTTVPSLLTQLNGITLKGEASMLYE